MDIVSVGDSKVLEIRTLLDIWAPCFIASPAANDVNTRGKSSYFEVIAWENEGR